MIQSETKTLPADDLVVYDLWEMSRPRPWAHSRLYSLEPIGLGTPYTESLTGYVSRLAEAHSVPTRRLVVHELLPLLRKAHLSKVVNSSLSSFWLKDARALNGISQLATDWVRALEAATQRNELRFLTLLPWAGALTSLNLLRPTRAWCPECYEEWRQAGQVVYEPLLWGLVVITICPRHRRYLRFECPHADCRAPTQPGLAPWSRPGYCSRCGSWLGAMPAAESDAPEHEPILEDEWIWQTWINNMVGEMIACAPKLSVAPRQQHLVDILNAWAAHTSLAKGIALARHLQLSGSAVSGWRRKGRLPRLATLLRLCHLLQTSPLRLLTEGTAAVDFSRVNLSQLPAPRGGSKRPRRPFGKENLRQDLEAVLANDELPPPSMCKIARQVGYAHATLHHHFPDLCRAISARYMAYRKQQGEQKRQQLCEEVRQAVAQIHARGIYPSGARVASLLSVPGSILHPDAQAVWHQLLRELGWES